MFFTNPFFLVTLLYQQLTPTIYKSKMKDLKRSFVPTKNIILFNTQNKKKQ